MISPNPDARTTLKLALAKDVAKAKLRVESPLKEPNDLKAFWKRHPGAKLLFGHVIVTWRQSSAMRPGSQAKWAAYPYTHWCGLAGQTSATLRRNLDVLEQTGLIARECGPWDGKPHVAHLRPTALALHLSKDRGRPTDWQRLGHGDEWAALQAAHEAAKPPKPPPLLHTPKPAPEAPATKAEVLAILNGENGLE